VLLAKSAKENPSMELKPKVEESVETGNKILNTQVNAVFFPFPCPVCRRK